MNMSATYTHVPAGYNNFRRCGEITTAFKANKLVYALNCNYCDIICFQIETFALHIEKQHLDDIQRNVEELEESEVQLMQTDIEEPEDVIEKLDDSSVEGVADTIMGDLYGTSTDLTVSPASPSRNQLATDPLNELNVPLSATSNEILNAEESFVEDGLSSEDLDHVSLDLDECEDGNQLTLNPSDNKDPTLAIIKEYEKHTILWDENYPTGWSVKKRNEAIEDIATVVNQLLGLQLTCEDIGDHIKRIRYNFCTQRRKLRNAELKGKHFLPGHYYHELSFLNEAIKWRQRNKRGTKVLASEKPALPISSLTNEQNYKIIELYKSCNCLWDIEHSTTRFKVQREEALKLLTNTVNETMNLNLTTEELRRKLYRIRYACTQEKHRKIQAEHMQQEYVPVCSFYKEIAFLEDIVGPFKCSLCEEIFYGTNQYKVHMSTHDGSMPFVCPICNRGFMSVGNRNIHIRRHTRDYQLECKVCKKRYATTTDLNVHMRYHTGEKPYICEICGKSFRTWTYFDSHKRRHQKLPGHKCSICSKAFYENNKLTDHMKTHLNVRDQICNVCGKAFTTSKNLRQHKEIHAATKKYICKICGKDFAQYAGLSGHMKSHGTGKNNTVTNIESSIL